MKGLMLLAPLLLLTACGAGRENPPLLEPLILPMDGSNIRGIYMAKLQTLNPGINGTIPGSVTLQRVDDEFKAYVRLFSGGPNTWHQQYITVGRCPGAQDDLNQDGVIDGPEGRLAWGDTLIPLDNDIRSQRAGIHIYPLSDEAGSYYYERTTSFEKMFADLKEEDVNFEDHLAKLGEDEGLHFPGKIVVILGVSDQTLLPATVASFDNYPVHQTVPIACGVLDKLTQIPGEDDNGIPGPVEEVTPGEGTPAPGGMPIPGEGPSWQPDDNAIINWWRERWRRWRGDRRDRMGDGQGRSLWDWWN